jgi:hypothetical protein
LVGVGCAGVEGNGDCFNGTPQTSSLSTVFSCGVKWGMKAAVRSHISTLNPKTADRPNQFKIQN